MTRLYNIAQSYLDTSIADRARCIGSQPDDPSGQTQPSDRKFKKDTDQLIIFNSLFNVTSNDNDSYWLASRGTDEFGAMNSMYGVRRLKTDDPHGPFYRYPNSTRYLGGFVALGYDGNEADINGNGYISEINGYYTSTNSGFRPVIRIKNTTKIQSGTGTKTDPYVLSS